MMDERRAMRKRPTRFRIVVGQALEAAVEWP